MPPGEVVGRISNAGQQMEQLVTDLPRASTVARGELVRVSVDLERTRAIGRDALAAADPGRDVEPWWSRRICMNGPMPDMVRVVLENLVNNAWKFTSKTPAARIPKSASSDGRSGLLRSRQRPGFRHFKGGSALHAVQALALQRRLRGNGRGPCHGAANRPPPRRASVGRGRDRPGRHVLLHALDVKRFTIAPVFVPGRGILQEFRAEHGAKRTRDSLEQSDIEHMAAKAHTVAASDTWRQKMEVRHA